MMRSSMRCFDSGDAVSSQQIILIPVIEGIVGTIEGKFGNEIWTQNVFEAVKHEVENYGFTLDVIESVPVADRINFVHLPNHSRMIWGETRRIGYGSLYDRAMVGMYLYGLWQGIQQ